MVSIFERQRLTPDQLRTVSDRRFGDACCLLRTKQNERASGAMYMGGFVVECLLKARLLEAHSWLQSARSADGRSKTEQQIWKLCYSHKLDEILAALPHVERQLLAVQQSGHPRLLVGFKKVCAQWTIFARYSSRSATVSDAREFLSVVKEVKKWLR